MRYIAESIPRSARESWRVASNILSWRVADFVFATCLPGLEPAIRLDLGGAGPVDVKGGPRGGARRPAGLGICLGVGAVDRAARRRSGRSRDPSPARRGR